MSGFTENTPRILVRKYFGEYFEENFQHQHPFVWDGVFFLRKLFPEYSAAPSDHTALLYSDHTFPADMPRDMAGWNREHSWPKSYGVGYSGPDYSDLHHLYAADWNVNSARNNLYFDDCPISAGCSSPAHAEADSGRAIGARRQDQPNPAEPPSCIAVERRTSALRYHDNELMTGCFFMRMGVVLSQSEKG